ncbi:MAG: DNA-3-methyladenine glycosylase I [Acidimicrobiia bacterium]|nr:DNA-3-methyladenine glycosylase I [bacterium]MDE0643252.1 DNA-3-methyladenine glycosylase I [bacterium]MXX64359.1 DNA-3-methyladenine glycosylase I [Acidimicrobiia bacterium]
MEKVRCTWVNDDPLYISYHDEEWGVPVHDDRLLFEMLVLEGAQAGLSWYTILKKRPGYRRAFDGFDPERMVGYDEEKIAELLTDEGIVRNRLKIQAAIGNARAWLEMRESGGGLGDFLWSFTGGKTIHNTWRRLENLPASTPISQAMSKELRRRGFRFVGPTICYAFMQATGMVNDHLVTCFRWAQCGKMGRVREDGQ